MPFSIFQRNIEHVRPWPASYVQGTVSNQAQKVSTWSSRNWSVATCYAKQQGILQAPCNVPSFEAQCALLLCAMAVGSADARLRVAHLLRLLSMKILKIMKWFRNILLWWEASHHMKSMLDACVACVACIACCVLRVSLSLAWTEW